MRLKEVLLREEAHLKIYESHCHTAKLDCNQAEDFQGLSKTKLEDPLHVVQFE